MLQVQQQQQQQQQQQEEQQEQQEEEEAAQKCDKKMCYKLRYEKHIILCSAPARMLRAHEQHQRSHYYTYILQPLWHRRCAKLYNTTQCNATHYSTIESHTYPDIRVQYRILHCLT